MIAVVRWFQWVALALWLGGLIGIGALSAPAAFNTIRHDPAAAALTLAQQNALAGTIVGAALRNFNSLCVVLSIILLIGAIVSVRAPRVGRRERTALTVEWVSVLILIGSLVGLTQMFPVMDADRAAGRMTSFDMLHKLYVNIANGQMIVLLALAAAYVARSPDIWPPAPKS